MTTVNTVYLHIKGNACTYSLCWNIFKQCVLFEYACVCLFIVCMKYDTEIWHCVSLVLHLITCRLWTNLCIYLILFFYIFSCFNCWPHNTHCQLSAVGLMIAYCQLSAVCFEQLSKTPLKIFVNINTGIRTAYHLWYHPLSDM